MPSQAIENLRTQFLLSLGLNEYTPIPIEAEADLQDRWEQYLFAAAGGGGGIVGPNGGGVVWQPSPPARGGPGARVVPFGDQAKYQPGRTYTIGGATYVGPPAVGSVYAPPVSGGNAPRPASTVPRGSGPTGAPNVTPGAVLTGGGTSQGAPPRRS